MIVAKLIGGPHDGREIAVHGDANGRDLPPICIPYVSGASLDKLTMTKCFYYPDMANAEPCNCCARSEVDWNHGINKETNTLTSITYARHWVITYRFRESA